MIRSIFNRSVLATVLMLATSQMANAALNIQKQDPNDDRNPAGAVFKAAKRNGSDCPYAVKVARNANTAAQRDHGTSPSQGGKYSGHSTVN